MTPFRVVLIANDEDHPLPDWVAPELAVAGIDFEHHECYTRADLEKCASDADVIWLMSSREDLVVEQNMDVFRKAGAVIKCGSGTDNIDHNACTSRGIIVAHTPDSVTEPTSDHTVAMLLTAVRRTAVHDRLIRGGVWSRREAEPIALLTGADLGMIGCGRIGQEVVRKLTGFRMNVRIFDPYVSDEIVAAGGGRKVNLEELLKESQFVIVACPLADSTRGLIGENELRMMRQDAVLVNCARAGIVDHVALTRALKEGWIASAALDVLEKEALESSEDLLSLPNVNFTPHLAGNAPDSSNRLFRGTVDVIIEMSKMHKPKWIVNKDVRPKWQPTQ